jgi:hypothetical protein
VYYFLIKTLITACIVATSSELARRYDFVAAILLSLPLTSILAFIWTYHDTHDVQKIINLSYSVFYLVIPSLVFFLILPYLLKQGIHFYLSLMMSCGAMFIGYKIFTYFHK